VKAAPDTREVTRGMHALLYLLTALTFLVGTQLLLLAEHTDQFFSWTIGVPMTAAFVGGGFWGAATVVFWCARQRDWARGRVVVPTVAIVVVLLLIATLQNLGQFHGLLGLAWIEVYVLFGPALGAIAVMQLVRPGKDRHSGERLDAPMRLALWAQAAVAIVVGLLLFTSSDDLAASMWSWDLTDLTSKAVGTWLVGTGATCAVVALLDDRAAAPGWALAQIVFALSVLLSLLRFAGDIDFGELGIWLLIAFFASMLVTGIAGAVSALREGRFAPVEGVGGVPVELRQVAVAAAPPVPDPTAGDSPDGSPVTVGG
jgi:hypothetical protein